MDFAQRSSSSPAGVPTPSRSTPSPHPKKDKNKLSKVLRWGSLFLLISIVILVVALIGSIASVKTREQSKYVNESQYQAVFLNGGQVYFGKITALNAQYVALSDIYYLRVNQSVQPNDDKKNNDDVSLVKLGCELHGPQDQMLINSDQVIFWENLKSDGQVAKAVAEYQKQNPNGQKCETTTSTTDTTKKP